MLPLFTGKKVTQVTDDGNRGLYFNKFFDQWKPDFKGVVDPWRDEESGTDYLGGKMNWILCQMHQRKRGDGRFREDGSDRDEPLYVGNKQDLRAAVDRRCKLVDALCGDEASERPWKFRTSGPFVTGMGLAHPLENGFLWHHTLGVPYLPGSSIKGMIRAWAEHWLEEETTARRLFGISGRPEDGAAAGCLVVFDALPIKPVRLMAEVITPHDGGWRIKDDVTPSDWVSPNPIPFLAVASGTEFHFALAPRKSAESGDLETAYGYLEEALDWIGAGAKTAVGFGHFEDPRNQPPQQGDRVTIQESSPKVELRGKSGTVEMIFAPQELAKLKLDGGGKGSNPVVRLADLRVQ